MSWLHAPELLLILRLTRAAIAGADRIDEDEVGHVEPGARIVDEARRRTLQFALVVHLDRARADTAEMQIGCGGARAAVEDEGDGTLGVQRVARIGDVEDVRRGPAAARGKGNGPGFRRVVQRLTRDGDGCDGSWRWAAEARKAASPPPGFASAGFASAGFASPASRALCVGGLRDGWVARGQLLGERKGRAGDERKHGACCKERAKREDGLVTQLGSIGEAGRRGSLVGIAFGRNLSSRGGRLKAGAPATDGDFSEGGAGQTRH